jgi:hypothetical protein
MSEIQHDVECARQVVSIWRILEEKSKEITLVISGRLIWIKWIKRLITDQTNELEIAREESSMMKRKKKKKMRRKSIMLTTKQSKTPPIPKLFLDFDEKSGDESESSRPRGQ